MKEKEDKEVFNKTQPLPSKISRCYNRIREPVEECREVIFASNSIFKVSFYSLLKELGRTAEPKTKKKILQILRNYSEKAEYKEKVIDFFEENNLFNKDIYKKNSRSENEKLDISTYFQNSNPEEFGIFKQKNDQKLKLNFAWKTKRLKNRCRTRFSIIESRSRKVLLGVDSLPMNAKKVKPTIQKLKDTRSRIQKNDSEEDLKPCLFFLNGQGKHLHYFDLVRRKHANVHSPILSAPGKTIDDYYIEAEHIFVKAGKRCLTFFKISEFSSVKTELFDEDILSVSSIGNEKVMVLTKNKDYVQFYDFKEKAKFKVVCNLDLEKNESENFLSSVVENIGFVKLMPDNRVFIFRSDYVIFEMNLRLEMIKMR